MIYVAIVEDVASELEMIKTYTQSFFAEQGEPCTSRGIRMALNY